MNNMFLKTLKIFLKRFFYKIKLIYYQIDYICISLKMSPHPGRLVHRRVLNTGRNVLAYIRVGQLPLDHAVRRIEPTALLRHRCDSPSFSSFYEHGVFFLVLGHCYLSP